MRPLGLGDLFFNPDDPLHPDADDEFRRGRRRLISFRIRNMHGPRSGRDRISSNNAAEVQSQCGPRVITNTGATHSLPWLTLENRSRSGRCHQTRGRFGKRWDWSAQVVAIQLSPGSLGLRSR